MLPLLEYIDASARPRVSVAGLAMWCTRTLKTSAVLHERVKDSVVRWAVVGWICAFPASTATAKADHAFSLLPIGFRVEVNEGLTAIICPLVNFVPPRRSGILESYHQQDHRKYGICIRIAGRARLVFPC